MQIAEAEAIESIQIGDIFRALPCMVNQRDEHEKCEETDEEKHEREKREAGLASIRCSSALRSTSWPAAVFILITLS